MTLLRSPVVALAALAITAVSLQACVQVRESDTVTLDGTGVQALSARNDRGDVSVFGRASGSDILVTGTAWGSGSRRDRAEERQGQVSWDASVDGRTLVLDGVAREGRSGVDLDVTASEFMDLDIVADAGTVEIRDIEGLHVITATNIIGRASGDLDIYASSSIDLDFVPYTETDTLIESESGVTLAIPFGLEYDLTVRADINDSIEVAELGWDDLVLGEGFVNGRRGRGDIEIDIQTSGPVRIVELR